jgi:hypothetical protein
LIIEDAIDHDDPTGAIRDGIRDHPYGARLFGLPRQSA